MPSDFKFVPNPNLERDLERMVQNSPAVRQLAQNIVDTLDRFQAEYAGQDVSVVKPALLSAWASTNEGAHLGEPTATKMAEAISERRRVWIDEHGSIMVADSPDE